MATQKYVKENVIQHIFAKVKNQNMKEDKQQVTYL